MRLELRWLAVVVLGLAGVACAGGPVRESIEWCNIWVTGANQSDLPKVLLVGDSIVMGYYQRVADGLKDKAYCARLATSKSLGDPTLLDEVKLVLSQNRFAVIHFNNGLHGWGYTEDQYEDAFPQLLATLRQCAPKAKLIWATTTPVRHAKQLERFDPLTVRVQARNDAAEELVKKAGIPIDDLYTVVEKHPEYYGPDGVHFNPKGVTALADQVIKSLEQALKGKP
jgi:hypothetical protein